MSITFNMILREELPGKYVLIGKNGIRFYEFRAGTDQQAITHATAYMSTWTSVSITVEKKDESSKKDRVSPKT
jgi:hypothetical protein